MQEKPKQPAKKRVPGSFYFTAVVIILIVTVFYVGFWRKNKERELYNSSVSEYNRIVANHGTALKEYQDDLLKHIRSIDQNYDIDSSGNMPVFVTVKYKEDSKSQYIGSEMKYSFSVNGHTVSANTPLYLNVLHETTFFTEIIEDDPVSDDIGIEEESISLGFLVLNDGVTYEHTVRIRENFGNDAGHVAIYHVTYTIAPQQHIELTETQKLSFPQCPILPQEPKKEDFSIGFWEMLQKYSEVYIGIVVIFMITALCLFIYGLFLHSTNAKAVRQYNEDLDCYNAEKTAFINGIAGRSIRELSGVPDDVEFSDDDLPYTKDDQRKYGEFTLFVTPSGNRYHTDRNCCRSNRVISVHSLKISGRYKPCSKCAIGIETDFPDWYSRYLDYKKKIKAYEITDYMI